MSTTHRLLRVQPRHAGCNVATHLHAQRKRERLLAVDELSQAAARHVVGDEQQPALEVCVCVMNEYGGSNVCALTGCRHAPMNSSKLGCRSLDMTSSSALKVCCMSSGRAVTCTERGQAWTRTQPEARLALHSVSVRVSTLAAHPLELLGRHRLAVQPGLPHLAKRALADDTLKVHVVVGQLPRGRLMRLLLGTTSTSAKQGAAADGRNLLQAALGLLQRALVRRAAT